MPFDVLVTNPRSFSASFARVTCSKMWVGAAVASRPFATCSSRVWGRRDSSDLEGTSREGRAAAIGSPARPCWSSPWAGSLAAHVPPSARAPYASAVSTGRAPVKGDTFVYSEACVVLWPGPLYLPPWPRGGARIDLVYVFSLWGVRLPFYLCCLYCLALRAVDARVCTRLKKPWCARAVSCAGCVRGKGERILMPQGETQNLQGQRFVDTTSTAPFKR